jgi:Chaperone for flagella basal body P-ring formation
VKKVRTTPMTSLSRGIQFALPLIIALGSGMRLAGSASTGTTVALRTQVMVRGSKLTLADLLPNNAPDALEMMAETVDLGAAPQAQAELILNREGIQNAIESQPEISEKISIPAHIRVERFHRALSSKEIADALNAEARRRGLTGNDPLHLAGTELSAPVEVTCDQPGLRVIGVQADPLHRTTSFHLVAEHEPGLVPFDVILPRVVKLPAAKEAESQKTGKLAAQNNANAGRDPKLPGAASAAPQAVPFGPPKPKPVLVEPGALATLFVIGHGFTIKAVVVPLQEGSLGQQIRVRSLTTNRVISAEVTGTNSLRSTL